ncbi:MAG: DMT family transporter [Lachnospiraceae bacterium]|nr:DMT family transporter [Lachnospiraceae bacterium]MDE6761413.1 DMT family transporter [Lachnospiraceae bacterium]
MWGFLIACISGALMSIQGVFNTGVTKETGTWLTNCFVQLTAFLVCLVFFLFTEQGKVPIGDLFKVEHKYMLLGGAIGAFITLTVIQSMSSLGPAKAILAIVVTQVLVGYLIELFGLFGVEKVPFSMSKLIGVIIAIAGIVVFKWES